MIHAENVWSLIARSGRSLRSLETKAGFGRNDLSRIVGGCHLPRRSTVERLAGALSVDCETLAASLARSRATHLARKRRRPIFASPRG